MSERQHIIWRVNMSESKPIKVLIVCAIGMSSSLLEEKTTEAAKAAGVELEMMSCTTPDAARWDFKENYVDVLLIAPQVRYKRKSLKEAAGQYGTVVDAIESVTYGMVDGEKLFKQIMTMLEAKE
jgi:PTS system cellobiose-specific IIB component